MREPVPFTMPSISAAEREAVLLALDAGALGGNGPIGTELQRELAQMLGVESVLLTTSCSHAMEMAAMALGLGPGDEVIMPSFTFVTTASSIAREGARPVFVEIDERTLNVDPNWIEASITPRTKAIFVVHYAGQGCAMNEIMDIANRHGIPVIEDAAQGLGASYDGQPLGTIGDIGCFSFHVTKNIVGGEAGAFVTNDPDIALRAEIIREKGTNRSQFLRGEVDKYTWVDLGSSFVPTDLVAALIRAQMSRMDELHDKRRKLWERYQESLAELEIRGKLRRPCIDPKAETNWHLYGFTLADEDIQEAVLDGFRKRGIGATFHFVPLHSSPYAMKRWDYRASDLPITERVARSLIRLPLFPDMTDAQQDYVISSLYEILDVEPAFATGEKRALHAD